MEIMVQLFVLTCGTCSLLGTNIPLYRCSFVKACGAHTKCARPSCTYVQGKCLEVWRQKKTARELGTENTNLPTAQPTASCQSITIGPIGVHSPAQRRGHYTSHYFSLLSAPSAKSPRKSCCRVPKFCMGP